MPRRDRLGRHPHRQAAAVAQRDLVLPPVLHPVPGFRDLVTAGLVMLVRHRQIIVPGAGGRSIILLQRPTYAARCRFVHQRPGLKVFGAGEWQMAKHGGRDRRTWRKLHLAIDPDTGEVLASALTTTEEGDASLVRPLLDQIAAPIAAVLADGAYDGDPVYRAVADRAPAATVIIPPRATAVVSEVSAAGTPTPRDRHIEMIAAKGRLGWQKAVGYGRRSLV